MIQQKYVGTQIITLLVLIIILSGCARLSLKAEPEKNTVSRSAVEMGTVVSLTLYAEKGKLSEQESRALISKRADRILEIIEELDQKVLSWRSADSEVSRFNDLAAAEVITVSQSLSDVIEQSIEICGRSGSALDITLRPVIDLWGIESYDGTSDYCPPDESSVNETAALTGIGHVIIDENEDGSASLSKDISGVSLDLGAVGKGYALDAAVSELAETEISGAVIAVGGSVLAYGDKGDPWQIGIRDPDGAPNDYAGILSIAGEEGETVFISTSGGYEKYVEYEDRIFEHIIDGRTLHPAAGGLASATIVTKNSGLISDGLSTACYLLGTEASKPLLDHYHADAVFITRDHEIFVTGGLRDIFSLNNSAYSIIDMP